MIKNIELGMLLSYYGAALTENQQKMLEQHVDEDLSLSEIAELEGVSRQAVHDAIKRAENQLYDMERRLGFVAKVRSTQNALSELISYVQGASHDTEQKQDLIDKIKSVMETWEEAHGI